jgi:hypothetical protein
MKYPDPYEGMSDAEVDEEVDRLFAKQADGNLAES